MTTPSDPPGNVDGRGGPGYSGLTFPSNTFTIIGAVSPGVRPPSNAPGGMASMIALPEGSGLRFDVHLQGPNETTFLAWD